MRYISFVLLLSVLASACSVQPGEPTSSGAEITDEPFVESSFEFENDNMMSDLSRPTSTHPSSAAPAAAPVNNTTLVRDNRYGVVETYDGFAVIETDPATGTTMNRVDYRNTDSHIRSLTSPRIVNSSASSFSLVMKATTENGSEEVSFRVDTQPLRISRE